MCLGSCAVPTTCHPLHSDSFPLDFWPRKCCPQNPFTTSKVNSSSEFLAGKDGVGLRILQFLLDPQDLVVFC